MQVFQNLTVHVLNELITIENLLRPPASWYLEESDPASATFFCELDILLQVVNDIIQARCLGHEEGVYAFFLVVQPNPGDLDCLLRLELSQRHIKCLVEEHVRWLLHISRLDHLG